MQKTTLNFKVGDIVYFDVAQGLNVELEASAKLSSTYVGVRSSTYLAYKGRALEVCTVAGKDEVLTLRDLLSKYLLPYHWTIERFRRPFVEESPHQLSLFQEDVP